jgi:predicted PurR-regulated permease PerM
MVTEQFPQLRSNFNWFNDVNRPLARLAGRTPTREVVVAAPSVLEQVAFATPTVVIELILTLLMTFFMIEARVRLRRHLLLDRASFGTSLKAARIIRDVQDRVGSYILTVALINVGVGLVVAFGAWSFGLEAPIMWGGLAAILNFLPYIGPVVMIATLALFGIGTGDTIIGGVLPAAAFLGLHAVESNFITPSILGARFTVNPVLILLSISYFSWIWGVVGALLSVPILITVSAMIGHLGRPNLVGFVFGEPLFDMTPDSDTEDLA